MKTSPLGQLLTDEQVERVTAILNQNPDCIERVTKLKEYFRALEPELSEKGVLPDYLAYVVEGNYQFMQREIAANN